MNTHTPIEPTTMVLTDVSGKPKVHFSFLDGMRGLAAVYVMYHHAWLTVWTDPKLFPTGLTGVFTNWLLYGHVSVSVFIVISGFCLMMPVVKAGGKLRGGVLGFFKRRARRILPPYYFALALSCLLLVTVIGKMTGTHWDVSVPFDKVAWQRAAAADPETYAGQNPDALNRRAWEKSITTHVLLVQDFFDAYKLNHVFWSIAVEWQIYFLFPLMLILWKKRPGPILITIIMLGFFFWAQDWANYADSVRVDPNAHYPSLLAKIGNHLFRVLARLKQVNVQYVGLFTLGMLGATAAFTENALWCGLRSPRSLRAMVVVGVVAFAVMIAILFGGLDFAESHLLLVDFCVGIAVCCLMVTACHMTRHPVRDFLQLRPIVWLGTFSYSLYLIHAPLLQVIWQYMVNPFHLRNSFTFGLLAAFSTVLIPLASYLFFLVCERPFLNTPPAVKSPL